MAGVEGDHEQGKQHQRTADEVEEAVLLQESVVVGAFEDGGEEEGVEFLEEVVEGEGAAAGEPEQGGGEVAGEGRQEVVGEEVEEGALGEEDVEKQEDVDPFGHGLALAQQLGAAPCRVEGADDEGELATSVHDDEGQQHQQTAKHAGHPVVVGTVGGHRQRRDLRDIGVNC